MNREQELVNKGVINLFEAEELTIIRTKKMEYDQKEQERVQSLLDDGQQVFMLHYGLGNIYTDPEKFERKTSKIWAHNPQEAADIAVKRIFAAEQPVHMLTSNPILDVSRLDQTIDHEIKPIDPFNLSPVETEEYEVNDLTKKIMAEFNNSPSFEYQNLKALQNPPLF